MFLPAMLGPVVRLRVLTVWRRSRVMGMCPLSPALQLPLLALGAASHCLLLFVPRSALHRLLATRRPRLDRRRALGRRLRPTVVDRLHGLAVAECGLRSPVSLRRG